MANNNRIKLLRGNSSQIANSNKVLSYGQPLYNDDKNYITVGNSTGTKQVKAQPITVREVIGYYGDSTTISNSTSNQYKLSGDATNKTYLNTPDAFNINVNNVNKVSIDGTTATIKENVVVDNAYKITGTITNAENVANTIGSIPLTDIFESSGTSITSTIKNATSAQNATSATNADNADTVNNLQVRYADDELVIGDKTAYTIETLWTGYKSLNDNTTSVTISLTQSQINNMNIGDEIEIIFEDLNNGDMTGVPGWESKVMRIPIVNSPVDRRNGTFDIWDVECSSSSVSASTITAELYGTTLTITSSISSKTFSSSTGGGTVSNGSIREVRLIRKCVYHIS